MHYKLYLIPIILAVISFYLNSSIIYSVLEFLLFNKNLRKSEETLLTLDELKLYNGIDKPQLYLAVLGQIFDVSKGLNHYGPGKDYNIFVGRDASRNFITGKFGASDASDGVVDLGKDELRSLNSWVKFYKKQYVKIGKLIGRYYNASGKLTSYGKQVRKLIKSAEKAKEDENLEKIKFPPCNIEWDAVKGTRVWCTNKSGGVQRDWVGVPRQLFEPGSQDHRCACTKLEDRNLPNLKEYKECDRESPSCFMRN